MIWIVIGAIPLLIGLAWLAIKEPWVFFVAIGGTAIMAAAIASIAYGLNELGVGR